MFTQLTQKGTRVVLFDWRSVDRNHFSFPLPPIDCQWSQKIAKNRQRSAQLICIEIDHKKDNTVLASPAGKDIKPLFQKRFKFTCRRRKFIALWDLWRTQKAATSERVLFLQKTFLSFSFSLCRFCMHPCVQIWISLMSGMCVWRVHRDDNIQDNDSEKRHRARPFANVQSSIFFNQFFDRKLLFTCFSNAVESNVNHNYGRI